MLIRHIEAKSEKQIKFLIENYPVGLKWDQAIYINNLCPALYNNELKLVAATTFYQ